MSDSCRATERALQEAHARLDDREVLKAHLFGIAFGAVMVVSLALAITALMRWFVNT